MNENEIPDGYIIVNIWEEIKEWAIWFEPYHWKWYSVMNSIWEIVNSEWYTKFTHKGWKFANPITKI